MLSNFTLDQLELFQPNSGNTLLKCNEKVSINDELMHSQLENSGCGFGLFANKLCVKIYKIF